MRRLILVSALAANCVSAGCDSRAATPFSPSSVPSSAAAVAPPAGRYWLLTTTLTSVAGASVCFDRRGSLGARSDALLDVRRDGESITLLYDVRNYPTDHLELVGTVDGDRFEATTSRPGYQPCGGARVDYEFESYVTGQISEDGRSITASERWTYRLASDQSVVLWFAWEAQRP